MPRLPKTYADTFERLLTVARTKQSKELTAFWPQIDPAFEPGKCWLYVGRAVNGWGDGDPAKPTLVGPSGTNSVEAARDYAECAEDDGSPLAWMEEPNHRWQSGAFRATIRWLNSESDAQWRLGWTRGMAWSNLYKLAPWSGGNPSDKLCSLQFDICKKLLQIEVETLKPDLVVVLAGYDWFHKFAPHISRPRRPATTIRMGTLFGQRAIFAPHPGQAQQAGLAPKKLGKRIASQWERATS